jgi:hemerythrin-like metal-binding protein
MDAIEWNEDYSVGNDELDSQHQCLFEMTDALFLAKEDNNSSQIVPVVLQGLRAYASEHFQTEEKYMAQCGYPDIESQKTEHDQFRRKVADFCSSDINDMDRFVTDVVGYLYDWLTNHILSHDRAYAPYLKDVGQHTVTA